MKNGKLCLCYYCGELATELDHIPPKSLRNRFPLQNKIKHQVVDCCHECNTILGSRPPFDLDERKRVVKASIKERNSKLLKRQAWTSEELAELGEGLRSTVLEEVIQREVILRRLAW